MKVGVRVEVEYGIFLSPVLRSYKYQFSGGVWKICLSSRCVIGQQAYLVS
jgi:hypothetical protein